MTTSPPSRQPAGTPTGGQFAATQRAEADVELTTSDNSGLPGDAERELARRAEQTAQESWDRSDTDGFASQWANSLSAQKHRLQAEIDDNGGMAEFPALADLNGDLIPAKLVSTRYGSAWGVLSDPDDPNSNFTGFVNESRTSTPEKRAAALAKKGYKVVTVKAPAKADLWAPSGARGMGGATSVRAIIRRTDGGFSKDAFVVPDQPIDDERPWSWETIAEEIGEEKTQELFRESGGSLGRAIAMRAEAETVHRRSASDTELGDTALRGMLRGADPDSFEPPF